MPANLMAADEPAAGAIVHLRGGTYDSMVTTDAHGTFAFDPVPATSLNISASLGSCLRTGNTLLNVPENDTATVDLTLEALTDTDTISVGRSGAAYMEIDPALNRAILLFDSSAEAGTPAMVVLDLSTGQHDEMVFNDLTNVFDLEIISSDEVVFICEISGDHGLRFVNPTTLTQIDDDLPIPGSAINFEGRIAIDPNREHLFVTHTVRDGGRFLGQVFAVDVADKDFVDADNDPNDGEFAFDNELVDNSLIWAFNIAFDANTNEILVGNRIDTYLTAIDWTKWGQFDRTAGLAAPTDGVRLVSMVPPPPHNVDEGFRVEFWAFAGDKGVAAKNPNGITRYTQYDSPEGTRGAYYLEPEEPKETRVTIASAEYTIKVIPERDSWFSVFRGPRISGLGGNTTAIEERNFGTLQRRGRYESQAIAFDMDAQPHAFAVDPIAKVLYVAYANQTFVEVFCLQ
jgi:hypothetical protein